MATQSATLAINSTYTVYNNFQVNYNHMTSEKGLEIIKRVWKVAVISNALTLGSIGSPSIDPFDVLTHCYHGQIKFDGHE